MAIISNALEVPQSAGGGGSQTDVINWVYPVGSLYWSQVNTDPATLFPGTTWTQITDKFIYAAPKGTAAKTAGGASSVTLSVANMPSHTHTMSGSTASATPSMRLSGSTSSAGSHWHYIDDISMDGDCDVRCRSNTDWIVNSSSGVFSDSSIRSGVANGPTMAGSGGGYQTLTFNAYDGFSSGSTDTDGSHSHSLSSVSVTGGSHSHSINASINSTGSGQAFDIMPPYETAYCWRRES